MFYCSGLGSGLLRQERIGRCDCHLSAWLPAEPPHPAAPVSPEKTGQQETERTNSLQ